MPRKFQEMNVVYTDKYPWEKASEYMSLKEQM